MRVLFAAPAAMWDEWSPHLHNECAGVELLRDGDPAGFDALIYAPGWPETGEPADFRPYSSALLVQSLWAGVERIVGNPTLTQPLCRMVDPGLTQGMVEYCVGWAMRAHLGMDGYLQDGVWRGGQVPPLACERRVTVLGMGQLGSAVAGALAGIGFRVTGWSASGRAATRPAQDQPPPGAANAAPMRPEPVRLLPASGLDEALAAAEILICLLPDTPATRGLLNERRLALMPMGSVVINPGRGTLIVENALIAALDRGAPGRAVLDVFQTEPLPAEHPFWSHPAVTVTPHIAAATRPETAAPVVAENLRRAVAGEPLLYRVDIRRGY